MANEKAKQCKTKGCNNPVLDGNYCEFCKQKRKENKQKIMAGAGSALILVVTAAFKKGVFKQIIKFAAKGIQLALRK